MAIFVYDGKIYRFQRLAKEGFWIVAGQVAAVLGGLVLVRVLTEYLNPSEYGHLALGLTAAVLVNQLVMGGIGNAISRYYSIADEKCDLQQYFSASRRLMVYATIAVAAIGLTLSIALYSSGHSEWLILIGAGC